MLHTLTAGWDLYGVQIIQPKTISLLLKDLKLKKIYTQVPVSIARRDE